MDVFVFIGERLSRVYINSAYREFELDVLHYFPKVC